MSGAGTSVVILASRPASLARCLESLARADAPKPDEVLVVLNGRDAECAAAAAPFAAAVPGLTVVRDAPRSLGGARNRAAALARGSWLCFLDDDVTVAPDYFSVLEDARRRHPGACALGGPNLTPPGSPVFERCVGFTLGSPLAAGRMRRRYAGHAADEWTDDASLILCNLCLRADALRAAGPGFDEELIRNEENLLLQKVFRAGGRALHAPALRVFHERRSTLRAFVRQCFLSGRGRAEMTLKSPRTLRPEHLFPSALAACVLLSPLLPAARAAAALYAAAVLAQAACLTAREREGPAAFWWLVWLTPAAHLGYAAGMASGLSPARRRR